MMVLEDFGGESLHRLGLAGTLDLASVLKLAIAVAEILGQIHQRYIMHKDVNPSNIVLNPATGQVKLIDFGISTVLSRETPTFRNPNVLEGTLAYISPEQTGRMNRDMDYRTDFYSFGVTLYELLTGRRPFDGADALELVHSHIAKLPPLPQAIKPDLPPAVAAIVMKLLAKNAEDRYQSAYGIAADLAECLRQWQASGWVEPFPLGRYDSSDKFHIPQKLYGRQQEIAILLAAFDRVSRAASELLLVSRYAGVGMSALVHELSKPMTERRGYFIAGKFDQFQRNIPYSALIQAFRSLVQQLLTESQAAIAAWREELLAVLGPNGQVIQDAYIAQVRPRSVLCAPLLNQGKLTGMLYLENNLTAAAFTPDRLELLKLLAAQTAISIENASLYANLEQSERKYRTLFEDSRDTIFISGPSGEILDINPAGVDLFGYSKAELLHMNTVDFYVFPDARRRLLAALAAEGWVRDFEATLRTADGSTIDCLVTATVRSADDGTKLGFQGIIRDVTERRRIERERVQLLALQREQDVARHIQASLLPPTQVAWPGLDVVCYNAPAREVGGDFYAYRAQSSSDSRRRFVFALGDVTGKGVPAALLMAISMTSLQAIIPQSSDPSDLLRRLDQAIARYTRTTRQNCALVYVDIEPVGGAHMLDLATIRAANAGCVSPLIRRASGAIEWVDVGGMPLGTELGARLGYSTLTRSLSSGDMVILTSDGVIEANSPASEMFGFARLEQAVASGPAASVEAMLEHLRAAVDAFVMGGEPHDDVTIVVVRI
jgi:PAS domain S-box-containing protein